MEAMVYVGASKETVKELGLVIQLILRANVADEVQIEALKTLRDGTSVYNTTLKNCTFTTKEHDDGQNVDSVTGGAEGEAGCATREGLHD